MNEQPGSAKGTWRRPKRLSSGQRRIWARIGGTALLLCCLLTILLPSHVSAKQETASIVFATAPADPVSTPVPTVNPTATPGSGTSTSPSIVQQILHLFVFNDSTMSEAITKSLLRMFGGMLYDGIGTLNDVIHQTLTFLDIPGFSGNIAPGSPGSTAGDGIAKLEDMRFQAWKTMLGIAAVLLPLSLALTIGAAMREGTVSITGYASAREALLEWFISVAQAGASWLLVQLALQLSHYAVQGILSTFQVNLLSDPYLLRDLITGGISKGEVFLTTTPLLLQLFVSLFALFMVGAVAISLTLSILARYVLLFLITTTAPLMFILGALRPLRWLASFWSKAIVIAILLGPMNVLLLSLGAKLQTIAFEQSTGLVGTVLALLVLVGVLSVLISTNSMISKGVYGAATEIVHRAVQGVGQVLTLAFAVAGAAAGLGVLGAAGGTGAAGSSAAASASVPVPGGPVSPAAGGGTGVGMGSLGASAGGSHSGEPLLGLQNFQDALPASRSNGRLAGELGNILSSINTPMTRGMGAGLRFASGVQRVNNLMGHASTPGETSVPQAPDPTLDLPMDLSAGVPGETQAQQSVEALIRNPVTLLQRHGMAPQQAVQAMGEGLHLGSNAVVAAQEQLGIGAGRLLHNLGYHQDGVTMEQAGSAFLQDTAGAYAFGERLPWIGNTAAQQSASLSHVDPQDVGAAVQILASRPTQSHLTTPEGITTLSRLSYQLRAGQMYPTPAAVAQAASSFGGGDLTHWMEGALGQLPSAPPDLVDAIHHLRNSTGDAEAEKK